MLQELRPEQWRELFALLDTVLDLPEAERARWIESLDARRTSLKAALTELLARHAAGDTSWEKLSAAYSLP
jgi:hypothetical protein